MVIPTALSERETRGVRARGTAVAFPPDAIYPAGPFHFAEKSREALRSF